MESLTEQKILITGATDGLGKQVAQDLAERDATLLLHGRNQAKGRAVIHEIEAATGNQKITYFNADFDSLEEVRKMVGEIQSKCNRLDVLINNAGIGFGAPGEERSLSQDGYELRFQVNYLSCFLLTMQLLPLLRQSSHARIVNVASAGQYPLDFDNLMFERNYDGQKAYRQSKLAQIMFTIELAHRLDDKRLTINALHPATYMDTKLVRDSGVDPVNNIQKGAEAVEYLATSPELEGVSGQYFNVKQQAKANGQAYDEEVRRRLWNISEELIDNS